MTRHWEKEKEIIKSIREIKEQIDNSKSEAQIAERQGDLAKAAELRYSSILGLEKRLSEEKETQRISI